MRHIRARRPHSKAKPTQSSEIAYYAVCEAFAGFKVKAEVLDGAPAVINGSVDPFAPKPTFDVNMEVKKVQLPQVNPWLRQYIKADAEAGKFELYMELAAADGKFKGYAKPFLEDVDMYRSGEPEKNPL